MNRILVAEDSLALANLLTFVLRNAGYEVEMHRNGQTAWEALERQAYDAILLDQQMPLKTGLEVIQAIRSAGPNQQTPVFLCTAKSHELGLVALQSRLRIEHVFHKPFSPKELVAQLRAYPTPEMAH